MKTPDNISDEWIKSFHKISKFLFSFLIIFSLMQLHAHAQESKDPVMDGTMGEFFRQKNADTIPSEKKESKFAHGNEWDGTLTTMKLTVGFMYDYAGYIQDDASKLQIKNIEQPQFSTRDGRFILSGKFKFKREVTWKAGLMYSGDKRAWFLRETGVAIKLNPIPGHLFIGRTKEGYSMIKAMNGFSIWGFERAMDIDVIPILADGLKYYGYLPKPHIFFSLGAFSNVVSKTQSFATFKWQYVARIAWLPVYTDAYKPVLHIGINLRYGKPKDDSLQVRSKPEVNSAPYFVDTKKFYTDRTTHIGGEIFYRKGPLLLGTEFNVFTAHSPGNGDPVFVGGEAYVVYNFTGEVRPYFAGVGLFSFLKVKKSVFDGGPGAWEAELRFSSNDLDAGIINGGKFWRFTPVVTWHLSDMFRLNFAYGYGVLDKNNMTGTTHFFQSRFVFLLN